MLEERPFDELLLETLLLETLLRETLLLETLLLAELVVGEPALDDFETVLPLDELVAPLVPLLEELLVVLGGAPAPAPPLPRSLPPPSPEQAETPSKPPADIARRSKARQGRYVFFSKPRLPIERLLQQANHDKWHHSAKSVTRPKKSSSY